MLYLSLKWLHFIGLISWMAGILYLYRLLVYQAERGENPEVGALLTLMSRRLLKFITTPAMVVTYCAGIGMIMVNIGVIKGTSWFYVKFLMLLGMSGMTGYAGALIKKFEKREGNLPSSKTLRILNEVPTVLLLIIVALAVFRPF